MVIGAATVHNRIGERRHSVARLGWHAQVRLCPLAVAAPVSLRVIIACAACVRCVDSVYSTTMLSPLCLASMLVVRAFVRIHASFDATTRKYLTHIDVAIGSYITVLFTLQVQYTVHHSRRAASPCFLLSVLLSCCPLNFSSSPVCAWLSLQLVYAGLNYERNHASLDVVDGTPAAGSLQLISQTVVPALLAVIVIIVLTVRTDLAQVRRTW